MCKPAKCCMYLTVQVQTPKRIADFEEMLWHIAHQDVEYFVQNRRWFLMVHNPCRFNDSDGRCRIYNTRPKICRDHKTENCEFETGCDFDLHIINYEQMLEYASRRFPSLKERLGDPSLISENGRRGNNGKHSQARKR